MVSWQDYLSHQALLILATSAFLIGLQFLITQVQRYNTNTRLHSLAQDFQKPFDAPAILVVGHQTDGKSGKEELAAKKTLEGWRVVAVGWGALMPA